MTWRRLFGGSWGRFMRLLLLGWVTVEGLLLLLHFLVPWMAL